MLTDFTQPLDEVSVVHLVHISLSGKVRLYVCVYPQCIGYLPEIHSIANLQPCTMAEYCQHYFHVFDIDNERDYSWTCVEIQSESDIQNLQSSYNAQMVALSGKDF